MKAHTLVPRPGLLAWLVLLAASLACAPAYANCASPAAAEFPVRDVRAGEVVTLAWPGLPHEARELEVLLSVDGGARFTLRASAEIDAARASVRWHVPALPTAHARLRLRWGDGRAEHLLPPTPEFRILDQNGTTPSAAAGPPTTCDPDAAWDEDDAASAGPLEGAAPDLSPDAPHWQAMAGALPGVAPAPPASLGAAAIRVLPRSASARLRPAPPSGRATTQPRTPRRE